MDSNRRHRQPKRDARAKLVRLSCACATLRRTARLVTQLYDEAMRPTGLTGPQFTLLQTLKIAPGIAQNRLATILGMDSTTLTRSLALLRTQGWLSAKPGDDRRALRLRLTKAGEKEYDRVLPHWQRAQKRLKQILGDKNLSRMMDMMVHTAELITDKPVRVADDRQ